MPSAGAGLGYLPPAAALSYPVPPGNYPAPSSARGSMSPAAPPSSTLSHGGYSWRATTCHQSSMLCPKGVLAGRDSDGTEIYVGRSLYQGDVVPAKVIPNKSAAYISYNGVEVPVNNFEILVRSECKWVQSRNGTVPPGAFPVGQTVSGEVLYAGRVHLRGGVAVGKVHPSHGCCYIPYNGQEEAHKVYEVMVLET
ncbi:uncharacterized protein LOC113370734 [Ctenocephalides felis]|uniref:uncharacterized protein LOC113370734 n=1 Tax=Ctenocephalides felis TaxID=7515 RepID=UPI000E6E2BA4|nr:uncharacterized protein LOC113370734 [Ctenocephalides felis]